MDDFRSLPLFKAISSETTRQGVFISYRRDTSRYFARIVYDSLIKANIDVFYDVARIKTGGFDGMILSHIFFRPYFVPLWEPGALERCQQPDDWVLREYRTAIEMNRTIIPLQSEDFDFHDLSRYLPPDVLTGLKKAEQAVTFRYSIQDEGLQKLKQQLVPTETGTLELLLESFRKNRADAPQRLLPLLLTLIETDPQTRMQLQSLVQNALDKLTVTEIVEQEKILADLSEGIEKFFNVTGAK